ncbi:MAG TPA: translation initiation factor IF-2 [Candidatus Saccharibacteria bacterium]|nr:translation initiation factor IF-2 [Candidatus Saccharibacteria bacterium]HMT39870.1 translation initiation factor IF-2 [Candidatus Saccharibacteria bacterium]
MNKEENNTPDKILLPPVITVSDFAHKLGLGSAQIVSELMKNGVMATVNEQIDYDTAAIIANELGFEVESEPEVEEERPSTKASEDKGSKPTSSKQARPPIVAVMGHVDHGKTSLLDSLRKTDVAKGEAGGITQHIGAYQIEKNNRVVTFLDTPGHEAFAALREHGAKTCDVAIIVVAADDGVKPQTREAIDHAKAAGVSIVIAINKIDKSGADSNRVKQELTEIGIQPDDWGGDIPCVEVSAKTGENLDKLIDVVLLVADILDPSAIFSGLANGVVVESHLETGRGPVVTLLLQNGEIKVGDWIVVGKSFGKIRSLENYKGEKIKKATPAMPAIISGLKELPVFGDWFEEVENEKIAKDWINTQTRKASFKSLTSPKSMNSSDITRAVIEGKVKELAVLVKADTQGSLESLVSSLESAGNDEVRVKIIGSGIGDISESDINAASAGNALVLGFNVSISAAVNQLAKRSSVDFTLYKIIYELLDDVREWLSSLLAPEIVETEHARLKILGVFKTTKNSVICGGRVLSGKITPDLDVKIISNKEQIGTGKLTNLQKNKEASKEVVEGEECGLSIETNTTINEGDEIVFYSVESKARKL